MQKIISLYNNLSRGETDHDLMGRVDLPIYKNGSERFRNFWSDFKGNALFRPGFEKMVEFEDCNMVEFKFTQKQSYKALFYKEKIKFLSYDVAGNYGFVQSGGADLEVASPYSLAEAKEIQFTQNADVMYVVHDQHKPRKLTRLSASSFTFSTFVITGDPFDDPNAAGTTGYPACVIFFQGRLYYAAPTLKGTSVYGSMASDYDNLTPGNADSDGLEIAIAAISESITWLKDGQKSLLCGNPAGIVTINGGSPTDPITPSTITANISYTDGSDNSIPIHKDGLLFYIKYDKRNVKYFQYDLLTETFDSQDANGVNYDVTSGGISNLYHIKDKNDLIFMVSDDGDFLSLNFNQKESIAGWHRHNTQGKIKDLCKMYDQDGNHNLFALVERTNGFYIEKLSNIIEFPLFEDYFTGESNKKADKEAYNRVIAEKLKECRYLDSYVVWNDLRTDQITYDATLGTIVTTTGTFLSGDVGKNIVYKTSTGYEYGYFKITEYVSVTEVKVTALSDITDIVYSSWYLTNDSIGGIDHLKNQTVGIVADGGYLGDFVVDEDGNIELGIQVTNAVIGYRYNGIIQSYPIGMLIQLINTQLLPKSIVRAYMRFIHSAGGEFGTTPYNMVAIQKYATTGAIYDLPPLPMDGTYQITYPDDSLLDKKYIIKQTKPLPLNIVSTSLDVKYGDRT